MKTTYSLLPPAKCIRCIVYAKPKTRGSKEALPTLDEVLAQIRRKTTKDRITAIEATRVASWKAYFDKAWILLRILYKLRKFIPENNNLGRDLREAIALCRQVRTTVQNHRDDPAASADETVGTLYNRRAKFRCALLFFQLHIPMPEGV